MNHPLTCTILSFVLLAIGQISEAGPSTYEDCILESMKGVTSNRAAKAIEEACRTKFPLKRAKPTPLLKPPESYSLPLESLNNIPGTAGWSGYSLGTKLSTDIAGRIYNKTDNWVITEITIKIEPKDETKKSELTHVCRTTIKGRLCTTISDLVECDDSNIKGRLCTMISDLVECGGSKPKSEGTFHCPQVYTPKGKFEFDWNITEAKGYQLK